MTVQATELREDYTGNGTTAVYSYGWRIFKASDLRLVKLTAVGDEVDLGLGSDYSVQGVGSKNGGTITLLAGNLASGEKLAILSSLPYEQQTDFRNQGAFYPETHEDQFDRLTLMSKQNQSESARSLRKNLFGDYFDATMLPVRNLPEPTDPSDAATKSFADGIVNASEQIRLQTLGYRSDTQALSLQALDYAERAENYADDVSYFINELAGSSLTFPADMGYVSDSVLQARYNLGSVSENTNPPPTETEDLGLISEY